MKNHYKRPLDVNIDFYPPALDPSAQFLIDNDALFMRDDTLVRLMWWIEFNVIVSGGVITKPSNLINTQVSVGASFWKAGPPSAPISPWGQENNIISRAKLEPTFIPLNYVATGGPLATFAMKWATPAEGILTRGMHKGDGISDFPLVEFAMEVIDPSGVLYQPDANRVIKGWIHTLAIWATDAVVP